MQLIDLPSFEDLPSREEMLARVTSLWNPQRPTEVIPVEEALGRIPAADVYARVNLPVVRASVRDGIAVPSSRFAQGAPDTSGWKLGVDFVRADTGDDFDDDYDAVIMIEDVNLSVDGSLRIHKGIDVTPGMNTRGAGSTVREGERLVQKHLPLRPKDLAGLVMGGVGVIEVLKKPVVAFIPSGSELIAPGTPVARGKNIDTNSLLVRETLHELGVQPLCLPIVPDEEAPMERALDEALAAADLIILNGGSSKGSEDCGARLLHRKGQVLCHGVAAAPGKPLCAAIVGGKPVINLPGPFMAAYHGLEWCINSLVAYYLCQPPRQRPTLTATLTEELQGSDTVSFLAIVEVTRKADGSGYWATPFSFRNIPTSRTIASNAQYMTKIGEVLPKGADIEVQLLRGVEHIPVAGM